MNPTINLQLNHWSIRKFQDKEISKGIIDLLIDVLNIQQQVIMLNHIQLLM